MLTVGINILLPSKFCFLADPVKHWTDPSTSSSAQRLMMILFTSFNISFFLLLHVWLEIKTIGETFAICLHVSFPLVFELLKAFACIFRAHGRGKVASVLNSVWPEAGLKSYPNVSKRCLNNIHRCLYINWSVSK